MTTPPDRFSVSLNPNGAGWVRVELRWPSGAFDAKAQHRHDPFDEMIVWLESVVSEAEPATWTIDK